METEPLYSLGWKTACSSDEDEWDEGSDSDNSCELNSTEGWTADSTTLRISDDLIYSMPGTMDGFCASHGLKELNYVGLDHFPWLNYHIHYDESVPEREVAQLRKNSKLDLVGGDFYLISLTQKVSSSAHIEFHARIILQKFIQRSLIKISNEIIEDSFDETKDVFDLLDKAETRLYEVTQGNIKKSTETAQDLVFQAKKKIEEI